MKIKYFLGGSLLTSQQMLAHVSKLGVPVSQIEPDSVILRKPVLFYHRTGGRNEEVLRVGNGRCAEMVFIKSDPRNWYGAREFELPKE